MVKKSIAKKKQVSLKVTKKTIPKKTAPTTSKKTASVNKMITEIKLDKTLTKNFVDLQRVMIDQSIKIEHLTNQMIKLLSLFELSAKSLAKKETIDQKDKLDSEKLFQKIDNLFEQNKLLAKGITMIHEKEEKPMYSETMQRHAPEIAQRFAPQAPISANKEGSTTYHQSISEENQHPNKLPQYP